MVGRRRRYARIDRGEYILTLFEVPGTQGRALVEAAEQRLPELYPGDPDRCRWDFRRLKNGEREQLLIALIPEWRMDQRALYIPLFHAVDRALHRQAEGVRVGESGITDELRALPEGGFRLRHYRGDAGRGASASLLRRLGYRGAFRNRSPVAVPLAVGFTALFISSLFLFRSMDSLDERRGRLDRLHAENLERSARLEELKSLEEQAAEIRSAESARTRDPSLMETLELIATALPAQSDLVALRYEPRRTVVEIVGADALTSLEGLSAAGEFSVTLLGDIRPLREEPKRERYQLQLEPRR